MKERKFYNYRPAVFCAISVIAGILAGYCFSFSLVVWGIICVFAFIGFGIVTVLFTGAEYKTKIFFSIAFVLIFAIGLASFSTIINDYSKTNIGGHYYTIEGRIKECSQTEYGYSIMLENISAKGVNGGRLKYRMRVYVYGQADLDVGDNVTFQSLIQGKSTFYEGRFNAYDVQEKVKYVSSVDSSEITVLSNQTTVFEKVNLFIRDSLSKGLHSNEFTIAYALLLGNTEYVDYDVLTAYRESGVAHVFAVSGLHVGFLATVLNFLFDKLKANRLLKAIVIVLCLFFYSGVCGFSASSLRASVMAGVLLFSSIKGSRYDGLSSVGLACTLILLFDPVQLFCVGFQLSFVVVVGMILLSPITSRLLKFLPRKIANTLGAVLSAQIVGAPVMLSAFGQFSTISIIANLLLVPIVGVIFIFLLVGVLIGALFNVLSITLFLPNYALKFINMLITALDLKMFIVGGITLGFFLLFYYLTIIFASGLINVKRLIKIIAVCTCAVVCVMGITITTISDNNSTEIYVMGSGTTCATLVKERSENVLIVSKAESSITLSRLKRLSEREGIKQIDTVVFTAPCKGDLQLYVSKLNTLFDIENVYCYGSIDSNLAKIIEKSFDVKVYSAVEQARFQTVEYSMSYALNGYAVQIKIGGKRIAVLSAFKYNYSGYSGMENGFDLLVALDHVKEVFAIYDSARKVCYLDNDEYESAESKGTIAYRV